MFLNVCYMPLNALKCPLIAAFRPGPSKQQITANKRQIVANSARFAWAPNPSYGYGVVGDFVALSGAWVMATACYKHSVCGNELRTSLCSYLTGHVGAIVEQVMKLAVGSRPSTPPAR